MDTNGACGLRKQPIFCDATPGFPAKCRLRDDCRHSIMMKFHYPDLGSASDWLRQIFSYRRTTQIREVSRRQYRISALVSQTSLRGKTNGGLTKCGLFPQPVVLVLRLVHKGDFRAIFSYCKEFRESDWSAIYCTRVSTFSPLTLYGNGCIKLQNHLKNGMC